MINGFYIIAVIFVICLIAASIEDIREGEISEELLAIMSVAPVLWLLNEGTGYDIKLHMICGIGIFLILFADSLFGRMGGADVLVGSSIGFLMGTSGIYVMIGAFFFTLPYLLENGEDEDLSYPFLPYILMSFVLVLLFNTTKAVV